MNVLLKPCVISQPSSLTSSLDLFLLKFVKFLSPNSNAIFAIDKHYDFQNWWRRWRKFFRIATTYGSTYSCYDHHVDDIVEISLAERREDAAVAVSPPAISCLS